jgi:hypothetical protein
MYGLLWAYILGLHDDLNMNMTQVSSHLLQVHVPIPSSQRALLFTSTFILFACVASIIAIHPPHCFLSKRIKKAAISVML